MHPEMPAVVSLNFTLRLMFRALSILLLLQQFTRTAMTMMTITKGVSYLRTTMTMITTTKSTPPASPADAPVEGDTAPPAPPVGVSV